MAKKVRVSLANKCQLLFGAAVVLILTAALAVVGVRMQRLVREGQENAARELAMSVLPELVSRSVQSDHQGDFVVETPSGTIVELLTAEQAEQRGVEDDFLAAAVDYFQRRGRYEYFDTGGEEAGRSLRYIRAVRQGQVDRLAQAEAEGEADLDSVDADDGNPVRMLLLVRVPWEQADKQLMLNRIYIVTAGLIAGLLAIAVFWFITRRIILSPVRVLRNYAEQVSQGDLHIRSEVTTGDEFEQLSDVFNTMVENLKNNADQLRMTNKSLDLKLGELAEANVGLYEANKIKGEFLANVSHELRTPLNSIVGFAEVLDETLKDRGDPMDEKRRRYVANILASSRRLLDLINDLLDLAKIEAGRMDVNVSTMSVMDTAEGLLNLIRPQAEKRGIDLRLKVDPQIPAVHTDAGKVQQVLFNFLSNAIKFTPEGGTVTLSAALVDLPAPPRAMSRPPRHVRLSVSDTGPGIAAEDHERIFEKFTQLDPGVTKEYGGTGLGLTISRDLARLLHGRIELTSDTGRGATFSLVIPLIYASQNAALMPQ